MKAVKFLLYAAGGLVALAIVALIGAVFVVDGQFVKSRLERAVKEERNRTLRIEGEPKVSLFPKLGLAVGRTTLSEKASEKEFLSLDSASVSVAVLPLLSGEVAMDAVAIAGLKLNVVRGKDGEMNFADLAEGKPEAPGAAPPKIRVAAIRIERAQVVLRDEAKGDEIRVSEIELKTGALESDTPVDIAFAARVTGKKPEVDLRAQLAGAASLNLVKRTFALARLDGRVSGNAAAVRALDARIAGALAADPGRGEYRANEFSINAKGNYESDAFTLVVAAPQFAVSADKAGGAAVTADLKVKGPQRNIEARFRLEGIEGTAQALSIAGLLLDLDAAVSGNTVKGRISTPVKANLKTHNWEFPKLAFSGQAAGKKPEMKLGVQLAAAASVNFARNTFELAKLDGKASGTVAPVRGLEARLTGTLSANPERAEYKASGFSLTAKGSYENDAFDLAVQAPQIAVSADKAGGSAATAELKVKGPQRNVDARFKLDGIEGSAQALSIASMVLDLDAAVAGEAVKGRISAPVKANLKARAWDLPKIVANLTFTSPRIPQKTVTLPIQGSLQADYAKQSGAATLATKFDDSTIQARLGATRLQPLVGTFDLKIDRLNMDRYLPPKKDSSPNEPVDLSALKGPTLTGKAEIGALTVRRIKLANIKADIKLAGGRLEVSPHSASLYGGTLAGSLSADANGNRITAKETVQGVNVGPLLRDAAEQDRLDGRANVNLDVAMAGPTVAAMKKSLGGNARVELKDGAVKGINLAEAFRDVKSMLGSKSAKAGDPAKKTDFSEITASFAIKNGVARNDDLQGKSPFVRLTGAGDIDVGNSGINYLARATLAATTKGQGGQDLSQLAGVTVPVRLTGALEKPDVSVDFAELAAKSGIGKVVEKVGGGVKDTAQKAAGSVRDKIRGLFGR